MNPDGPGYKEKVCKTKVSGTYKGRKQVIHAGSFVEIPHDDRLNHMQDFTVQAFIWPTTPDIGRQAIVSKWDQSKNTGASFYIAEDNGGIGLTLANGKTNIDSFATGKPLLAHEWYFVAASWDAKKKTVTLVQQPLHKHVGTNDSLSKTFKTKISKINANDAPITMAAEFSKYDKGRTVCTAHFNGKIDSPRIASKALSPAEMEALKAPAGNLNADVAAAWDFSQDIDGLKVTDRSANKLHGEIVNMPVRGMTGWNWSGDEMCWRHAPTEYGAVHFHDDDIYDSGWEEDFTFTVPSNLQSGLYAARLSCGDTMEEEDYVPFAILPPRGKATAKICFLLPTGSYMAYANEHMGTDSPVAQLLGGKLVEHDRQDLYRNEHREYGSSCYDVHSDGSGVCYSSRLRPILNMRPKYRHWLGAEGSTLWQFNADTHTIDWLEEMGYTYDVITDEELHQNGLAALEQYNVSCDQFAPRVSLERNVGCDVGVPTTRGAPDVSWRKRLVLANRLSQLRPRRDGSEARGRRYSCMGSTNRRVLSFLHRRIWWLVATQRSCPTETAGHRFHRTRIRYFFLLLTQARQLQKSSAMDNVRHW